MANQVERRFGGEIRVAGENTIAGYAAVFNSWSEPLGYFREQIQPGAFAKTLQEQTDVRALINHNSDKPIGRTTNGTLKLWEDDHGLAFEVKLPDTSYAADLRESIKRGDISQNSFAFQAVKDRWSADQKERTLLEVKLIEISPVTFPAYAETSVSARSAGGDPMAALRARAGIARRILRAHLK